MEGTIYVSISKGLLEKKHRESIGIAIWEFMWLIDRITKIDQTTGIGWVLGGKPLKLKELAMGSGERTTSRNIARLKKKNYILTIRTPYGFKVGVLKAKKIYTTTWERYARSGGLDKTKVATLLDKSGDSNKTNTVDKHNKTFPNTAKAGSDNLKEMFKTHDPRKFDSDYEPRISLDGEPVRRGGPQKEKPNNAKAMWELLKWAETKRGGKFTNTAKQFAAMKKMRIAGIKVPQICDRWEEMENDQYWQDKGFDFMSVSNSFDKKR